jgi:hypothetical protein
VAGQKVLSFPGAFIRFGPGDRQLAFRDMTQVGIWEVAGHPEFTALHQPAGGVDFSPDGTLLATAGDGAGVWDVRAGRELAHLNLGRCGAAVFHPAGRALCTYGPQGLHLIPLRDESGDGVRRLGLGPPQTLLPFGPPQGARACYGRQGRLAALVSPDPGVPGARPGSFPIVSRLVRPPKVGLRLDPDSPRPRAVLELPGITQIALSPDGRWAAAGAWNWGKVRVWDLATGKVARDLPSQGDHRSQTSYTAFSPDGRWLVTSGPGEHRFWRVGSWERGHVLRRDRVEPGGSPLAYSPDGRLVGVCRSLQLVQLVEPSSGREVATLYPPEPANVSGLCFSPDGSRLATAHAARDVFVWDLRAVRRRLAELGLDWGQPAYPPPSKSTGPVLVRVRPEELLATDGKELDCLEAEDLKITGCADCDPRVQDTRFWQSFRWSNDRHLFCKSSREGYVELEVELAWGGEYRLDVYFTKASDYGIAEVRVDGRKVGEPFDGYDGRVRPSGKVTLGTLRLTEGAHRVRFTAVGKNPRSTHYYMGIDCLDFTPVK